MPGFPASRRGDFLADCAFFPTSLRAQKSREPAAFPGQDAEKMVAVWRTSLNSPAVRRLLQIVLLIVVVLVAVGMRYIYHRGLTKSWREWMIAEVRKHGVELSFDRLTVRPFRGLVAKEVRIFDSPARNRVLARMNEMVVEANYANAVSGKPFLDALTLVDTSLRIPIDPLQPWGPAVDVQKLNARILFPPNQVHLSHFDAEVLGIRVRAAGRLVVPADMPGPKATGATDLKHLAPVIDALRQLRYVGGTPGLTIRFSGDMNRPGEIMAEADLETHGIRLGSYGLTSLVAAATWQNSMLLVSRIEAEDTLGRLDAAGSFDPKSRTANLHARSGLDLPRLARAMKLGDLRDLSLEATPEMDVTASAQFPGKDAKSSVEFQLLGQVRLGKFKLDRAEFQGLTAAFSWNGSRWAIRDVTLRHAGGGELRGDAQQDYDEAGRGDFRLGLKGSMKPEAVAPLLDTKAAAWLGQFKFHDSPAITVSGRGTAPGIDTLSAAGHVQLGRMSYRGVEARQVDAQFRYQGRVLTLDSFEVTRAEGRASGGLMVDFPNDMLQLQQVRSTLYPVDAAKWVDTGLIRDVAPYRFPRQPPSLLIDGVVDRKKPGTRTRLNVIADAPGGLDYTFEGKELRFGPAKGRMLFTDNRLRLSDTIAELFGGTVAGDATISLDKSNPAHTANIQLSGVNFARLSKLYFDYEGSEGRLDANYKFTGKADEKRAMRGEGEVSVTDGNVFAIPFLGPLSEILNKIVPGMGYSRAHRGTMSFNVADGIITTRDLTVKGKGFSMMGEGRLWFIDDRMDFDVRINAQGLPGVLLFPVSKLFEYRASSKLSQPEWRPKMIPRIGGERVP
jgi:hypothetical protein